MKTFDVPFIYRSPLIAAIKNKRRQLDKLKKDFSPALLDFGPLKIYLSRHFGFCYGVENAIEISFRTIDENPGRKIFLLSEMIHNPQVNEDLQEKGVRFLQDTKGNQLIPFENLKQDDIVLIPAFGTTIELAAQLQSTGIAIEKYNTTCPFVEKVWNRSAAIAGNGYSIVIHGKPNHEETRATFSHASSASPSLIIKNLEEAITLGKYITGEKETDLFYHEFSGRFSKGFEVQKDLKRIGVVNQTTQLAAETQAITDYLRSVIKIHYQLSEETISNHFADTRDTLCYATNDNQSAVCAMLSTPADLAIVVGGYNSSNTTHLVELCEQVLPAYFISDSDKIISEKTILSYNYHIKDEILSHGYLTEKKPVQILLTSGASCPDSVVEKVIRKLASFYEQEFRVEKILEEWK